MKNFSLWTALVVAAVITSCGTSASLTSSNTIMDGIYYNPDLSSIRAAEAEDASHVAELTRETRTGRASTATSDTIRLDESREVTLPLELDKSYVVLLEGETYEERLTKFDDQEPSFTINFEYNMGYNPWYSSSWYYPWYGPSYHFYAHHHWYNPYHCHYPYGWYDPWYDPWYYPYYGPSYAWGWYDPWYGPGFYPGYYPGFYPGPAYAPGYGPGPAAPGREVVYGRRETSRPAPTQAVASKTPVSQGSMRDPGNEVNQIRGREVNRGVPAQGGTRNPGEVSAQNGTTQKSTTQRIGVNNYRKSSTPHRSSAAQSATTNRGSATATYNQNNSGNNTTRYNSQQSQYRSNSGYQSGGGAARSSGSSSGGGAARTGGRR